MKIICLLTLSFLVLFITTGCAQRSGNEGWIFLSHTQEVSKKFDAFLDVQARTADRYEYLNSSLLRTALNYNLNDEHSIAFGVAYKSDREKMNDHYEFSNEYRVFQQYLYQFKILKAEITTRGRLEQRWVKEEQVEFSQRVRAFLSAQIPLIADPQFSQGIYAGIQNEIFLNITNKSNVNNSVLDQNRGFLSLGYRWSTKIDTEMGYMFLYQQGEVDNQRRNILQIQITTNF